MTLAIHLALAPLLLLQARRARLRIPKLPEAQGPRHGRIGDGPTLRLWLVGDSSAAGVGAATQEQALVGCMASELARRARVSLHWRVLARSGVNTQEVVGLIDELLAQAEPDSVPDAGPIIADVAVIVTGVNDVVDRLSNAAVDAARSQVLRHLRERFEVRHVVWTPMAPMGEFVGLPAATSLDRRSRGHPPRPGADALGRHAVRYQPDEFQDAGRRPQSAGPRWFPSRPAAVPHARRGAGRAYRDRGVAEPSARLGGRCPEPPT